MQTETQTLPQPDVLGAARVILRAVNLSLNQMITLTQERLLEEKTNDRPALKRFLDLRAASKDGAIAKAAGEALSAEAVAQLLGVTDKAIYKSQKEGRILGYQEPGKRSYLFPFFQFDGAAVAPWVPELIEILGPGFATLHFLTVKRKHLDGASHLDLLLAAKPDERHVVAQKILSEARSHLP
jgi:hypothetical protein